MEPRTDQQTGRRRILVVDGDPQIQRLLDVSLRSAGFDVRALATAAEALAALDSAPVGAVDGPDLIVSETKFASGPDGFQFCREIKAKQPAGSVAFVFLSEQTTETKMRGIEAGADDFLAKPLYIQEVVSRARALLQRRERDRLEALARDDARFVGEIEVFPLVDLLRAIEANRKSGVVHLVAPAGERGDIYFRDGAIVDAEVGRLSGLDAVCRLFSWSDGTFDLEWKSIRRKDAVGMEPGPLLMEALRRLDEWRRLLGELPPLETVLEVDYHLLAERLAEIPDEVNGILRLFDGQRSLMRVIDDCGFTDLDALAVIGKLFREQIVHDGQQRPALAASPGADIEGWIADAAGPFRGAPVHARRDLFGNPPEVPVGVHGRVTAPVEPLDEGKSDAVAEERRERFTDRLIAEGAPAASTSPPPAAAPPALAAPAAPPPRDAPEKTQMGLPPAPATPSAVTASVARTHVGLGQLSPPVAVPEKTQMGLAPAPAPKPLVPAPAPPRPSSGTSPSETTQQGLGLGAPPPLSTKPGFAAVSPPDVPPPRIALQVPIDVTPATRGAGPAVPPLAPPVPGTGDGVPQAVTPQPPQSVIVVPPPKGEPAPPAPEPPPLDEPRTVAGEILARASTQPFETRVTADQGGGLRRNTDPGLGPDRQPKISGELAASAPSPPTVDTQPRRKIILDQDMPEEDEPEQRSSGGLRWLLGGLAIAVPFFIVFIGYLAVKKTGKHGQATREAASTVASATGERAAVPVTPPTTEPVDAALATPDAAGSAAAVSTAASAARAHASPAPPAHHAAASAVPPPSVIVDERAADPKVARALPTEFPQLLAACRTAFGEKRAKDAELACTAAKDANPESPEASALLAHALFNRKKKREALQWAERAVVLDPKQADAYVIIGGVKQANDDMKGAKAAYRRYLELAPTGQYAPDLRAIVDSL